MDIPWINKHSEAFSGLLCATGINEGNIEVELHLFFFFYFLGSAEIKSSL